MDQAETPHGVKDLSDRELMEALYRAVYGEKPVHAGIATRVKRLETGFWVRGCNKVVSLTQYV